MPGGSRAGKQARQALVNAPGEETCKGAKFANVTKLSQLFTVKTEVREQHIPQYRTTWEEEG